MPGNRAGRLLQASRITPPLRGSRQDQGEARSRAGGGQSRRPQVTISSTGKPRMRRQHLAVGVSPWARRLVAATAMPWAKTGAHETRTGRQPLGSAANAASALSRGRPAHGQQMPHTPSREAATADGRGRKPVASPWNARRNVGRTGFSNKSSPGVSPWVRVEPRMRRQHLAVGVSPWTAMPHTPSREGGDSRWPWAKTGRKPLESSRGRR